ncbi:cystathionine gamma-synthase family protein [Pantoea ananatis]|uniref:cystathionine gamma-synthase family protein n=1 Tax=Pantoea ananas TaxID=553 RepID=UPI001F4D9A1E|nr:cystathionine gamma-synthase family protein [Pantoea ananatis]MCH9271753.1 cystathionine gamma-synthase family protein [Pantoea ananatis]
MTQKSITTKIVHADRHFGVEHGAIRKPIHTAVQYDFERIEDLLDVFQGKLKGAFNYSRTGTPTTAALEAKITMLEKGVGSICFSSGMGAIAAVFLTMLRAGDHLVTSRFVFAGTNSLLDTLTGFGVGVSKVDATCFEDIAGAITPETRMVFVETIANPGTEVPDMEKIGQLCNQKGILFVVDNTITSPVLFSPKNVCAGLAINSLSKTLGGHGAALGGVVTDTGLFDWSVYPSIAESYRKGDARQWGLNQLRKKALRDMGASLSSEHAHQIAIGIETLELRTARTSESALALARYLESHPKVKKVFYPFLPSHPQHECATRHFLSGSWLLSFEVANIDELLPMMNRLQIVSRATGMGDTRTLAIPVAPTVFWESGPEMRKLMNIPDGLVRVSVGLEDIEDLIEDFRQALG